MANKIKQNPTNDLLDKIPFHVLENILIELNIREIFQFGQAFINYKNFKNVFLKWLFSTKIRKMIHEKMESDTIFDFLANLQFDDFEGRYDWAWENSDDHGEKSVISFGSPPPTRAILRKFVYDEFEEDLDDNFYEPFDFSLNFLSGIFLHHLFNQEYKTRVLLTPVTNVENYSIGLWIKMPGQDTNKTEVSWTQKIFARLLLQAPKKIGIIYIQFEDKRKGIILPDFYDEPIKNDPENCHLYEYLMEWKLESIDGHRKASAVSNFMTYLLSSLTLSDLRVRNFFLWKKERFTKIYTPIAIGETQNYLESLPLGINFDPEDPWWNYIDDKRTLKDNASAKFIWLIISNIDMYKDIRLAWTGNKQRYSSKIRWFTYGLDYNGLKNYEIYGMANYTIQKDENRYIIDEDFFHQETDHMREPWICVDEDDIETVYDKSFMKLSAFDYYHDHDQQSPACEHITFELDLGYDSILNNNTEWLKEAINNEKILTNYFCNQHYSIYEFRKLKFLSELCLVDIDLKPEIAKRMLRYIYENDYQNLRKVEVMNDTYSIVYEREQDPDASELAGQARREKEWKEEQEEWDKVKDDFLRWRLEEYGV